MKNTTIFSFLLMLVIMTIGVGLFIAGLLKDNLTLSQKGISIYLYIIPAFIGGSIGEIQQKRKLTFNEIIYPIFSLLLAIPIVLIGSFTNFFILASFVSFLLGFCIVYFFSKQLISLYYSKSKKTMGKAI